METAPEATRESLKAEFDAKVNTAQEAYKTKLFEQEVTRGELKSEFDKQVNALEKDYKTKLVEFEKSEKAKELRAAHKKEVADLEAKMTQANKKLKTNMEALEAPATAPKLAAPKKVAKKVAAKTGDLKDKLYTAKTNIAKAVSATKDFFKKPKNVVYAGAVALALTFTGYNIAKVVSADTGKHYETAKAAYTKFLTDGKVARVDVVGAHEDSVLNGFDRFVADSYKLATGQKDLNVYEFAKTPEFKGAKKAMQEIAKQNKIKDANFTETNSDNKYLNL